MSNWFVFVVLLCYLHTSLCQVKFCEKNCQINEVFSSKVCVQHNTCYEESFNHSSICLIGPGCVCRQGFIRHQDTFQCVPITSCVDKIKPKQCAVNEFFSDCDAACQKTCTNNLNTARCRCVSGCVCRTGYIRSDVNYRCIPENSCRSCPLGFSYNQSTKSCVFKCQECRENETYKNCASCEPTCSNVTENHIVCTQNCREGCFCQKGFKRSPTTDLCVPEKSCRHCSENESMSCGNPLCEATCQTLGKKCTKIPFRCETKCYCDQGFVRALEGAQCVSVAQCRALINST